MSVNFVDQLLNLIFSPYGFLAIAIGLVLLQQAQRSRRLAWLIFSFCCYAASLGKYQDQWILEPPALVVPLQQIRDAGRPLTIILLALLILLGIQTANGWRRILLPQPTKYLIAVQIVIFFKTLFFADANFAFLGLITFGALALMLKLGPSRWLQDERNFHLGVWALAMTGVIFAIACSYQGVFNLNAMKVAQGRFLGTTGSSQHAAVLLAGTIPCLIFCVERYQKWDWKKIFWIASLLIVGYFLFITNSRTGAIMGITAVLSFYRQRSGKLIRLGLFIALLYFIVSSFTSPDVVTSETAEPNRYLSNQNTREGAWSGMWAMFVSNPLFGAPPQGDRLLYGESTWLAAGATLGLIGFIPTLLLGFGCLKMILQLHSLSIKKPAYFIHSSVAIAGLSCLLSGSFTEAIFLGNLSFPVIALLLYLSLGKYLLDVDHMQNEYMSWQAKANQSF
ncbi:MAG: O-antigen ligase domain-containing protein [Desmonostoc vinosum HA7617-LM4]|jgi:hypothetical protein|nr:O-antigen ligase domain-containing protein [Desmonostoc vinosum HA7617-LM4]